MSGLNTPVLVGVGLISQHEDDPLEAAEPIELMIDAALAAGADAGAPDLLKNVERILVPVGRWKYPNPAGLIASAIDAPRATTVSVHAGISQQTVLSDAASAIAEGSITSALIVGGEAGYRMARAKAAGVELADNADTDPPSEPDEVFTPEYSGILDAAEQASGLGFMPVGYYAILETAWRYARGLSLSDHEQLMAQRYARFSQTAADSPHGWDGEVVSSHDIATAQLLAYPYRKHHVSNWSVDQASALLMCSEAEADRLGVAPDKRIYPQAFTEANHAVVVSARGELDRSRGAEIAGQAALVAAHCGPDDLDFVELYTCFPIAVAIFVEALGLNPERNLSFSGAMPFGGGPFNNFVLHCTAQLAEHLRETPDSRGIISAVSGFLTKQGFAIWGTQPNPDGYQFIDVTERAAAVTITKPLVPDYSGSATVAGYTVLHDRSGPTTAIIVADTPEDSRTIAASDDPALLARLETEEFCGHEVTIEAGHFETL